MRLNRRDAVAAAVGAVTATAVASLWRREERGGASVDVRHFGARGDGKADDAAAIQRAIDSGAAELHFPAGTYRLGRSLAPRSGQRWRGDGAARSHLAYGGDPAQPPFNLVSLVGELADFSICALGFRGGRTAQRVVSPDGQGGFAVYLRGALRAVALRGCRVAGFGDGRGGGGGVVLGALPGQPEQGLVDVAVEDCLFEDNGNVPGVYVNGGEAPGALRAGVRLRGNRFAGTVGSDKVQNAIYVLGAAQAPLRQVEVTGNHFDFGTPVDVAVELNWVEGFTVAGNLIHFRMALPESTAILLRDGCAGGTVAGNTVSATTSEFELRGIGLVNFAHPGQIRDVTVTGNVLTGISRAIAVDRGSSGIVVSANRIDGGLQPGQCGIRVVDAAHVLVLGNMISAMRQAVVIGAGTHGLSRFSAVAVEENHFSGCGGAPYLIASATTGERVAGDRLTIRANRAFDTLAATVGLIDPLLAAVPGIRIADNQTDGLGEIGGPE